MASIVLTSRGQYSQQSPDNQGTPRSARSFSFSSLSLSQQSFSFHSPNDVRSSPARFFCSLSFYLGLRTKKVLTVKSIKRRFCEEPKKSSKCEITIETKKSQIDFIASSSFVRNIAAAKKIANLRFRSQMKNKLDSFFVIVESKQIELIFFPPNGGNDTFHFLGWTSMEQKLQKLRNKKLWIGNLTYIERNH